jgi:hypothetical protein
MIMSLNIKQKPGNHDKAFHWNEAQASVSAWNRREPRPKHRVAVS